MRNKGPSGKKYNQKPQTPQTTQCRGFVLQKTFQWEENPHNRESM